MDAVEESTDAMIFIIGGCFVNYKRTTWMFHRGCATEKY
jgi:hypothetical protein